MSLHTRLQFFKRIFQTLSLYGFMRSVPVALAEIYYEMVLRSKTGRMVRLDELKVDGRISDHGHMYVPCPYFFIYQAFNELKDEVSGATIIDFGCGLGRVLFFATRFPFAKTIGIEASPDLSAEASQNLQRYYQNNNLKSPAWEIVHQDAMTYEVPEEATIFFFNDPFDETVMNPVISNICQSQENKPRDIFVIYVNPPHLKIFEEHGFTKVLSTVNRHAKGFIIYRR